jgi:hypothetical protein
MVFVNYTLANITSLQSGFIYANTVTNGAFMPMIMVALFAIFVAIFYTSTKERSISVALFLCLFPTMLFVAAGVLSPTWLLLNFILFAASLIFLTRVSQ